MVERKTNRETFYGEVEDVLNDTLEIRARLQGLHFVANSYPGGVGVPKVTELLAAIDFSEVDALLDVLTEARDGLRPPREPQNELEAARNQARKAHQGAGLACNLAKASYDRAEAEYNRTKAELALAWGLYAQAWTNYEGGGLSDQINVSSSRTTGSRTTGSH